MIDSKKKLKFYIAADFIMNNGEYSFKKRLKSFVSNNLINKQLKLLRKIEYGTSKNRVMFFKRYKYRKLSYKTGIQISPNVFEYGLIIPHHGTIVVGSGNKIGPFCVLHTSTCITEGWKHIGKGFYLSSGAKVYKDIKISDFVTVGMNSVVNSNIDTGCSFVAGQPAAYIKKQEPWFKRDGTQYFERVKNVEKLKNQLNF